MNTALDELLNDLGDLGDDGDRLRAAIDAFEIEAGNDVNAAALMENLVWIAQQPRSVAERVAAMAELLALPRGRVFIPSAAQFFGWKTVADRRS